MREEISREQGEGRRRGRERRIDTKGFTLLLGLSTTRSTTNL